MLTTRTRLVVVHQYVTKVELSRDLAPALRKNIWNLVNEFSSRMKRQGRWATARYMHKRGFPIELALAAVY